MSEPCFEVADHPSMPATVISLLTANLLDSKIYLEFGAGGSTVLAGRLGVRTIVSVDSDSRYLHEIGLKMKDAAITSEYHAVPVDIGPTGNWGRPQTTEAFRRWPTYSVAPWRLLDKLGLLPDFVLIDGRFRVACFLTTLLSVKAGTKILFDDYLGRSHYKVVESFVDSPVMCDRAALFTAPECIDHRQLAFSLATFAVEAR